MRSGVNGSKIGGTVGVRAEVGEESLLDTTGNTGQFVDCLLETINVGGVSASGAGRTVACSRDVVETSQAVAAIEANDGLDDAAAEEAAAIVVDVKTEIDAGTQSVSA